MHNAIPPVTRIVQFCSPSCVGTNITVMDKETVTTESLKIRLDVPQFLELIDLVKPQITNSDPKIE